MLSSSAPVVWPKTRPGTWPGPTAHSGSNASPTSGSFSQRSSRFTSGRIFARPGWMSSSNSIRCLRATARYSSIAASGSRPRYIRSLPGDPFATTAISSITGCGVRPAAYASTAYPASPPSLEVPVQRPERG